MVHGTILVSGGAGYIGSHTVRLLRAEGFRIVILDNLVRGHRGAIVDADVELCVGAVGDREILSQLFKKHQFVGVVHFAAYAYVGESVADPLKYYQNNTAEVLTLLEVMAEYDCQSLVFSSTCATYGEPTQLPLTEKQAQIPLNPYGRSKLMVEWILADCDSAWDLKSVSLRYFNACGCASDGLIGADHTPETRLIPLVLKAIKGEVPELTVYGSDYPTPDGTCIRDYIHVEDLARAHLSALRHLLNAGSSLQCNLGTGIGVSVKEIIKIAEEVTGKKVPFSYGPRRAGDPAQLVADPSLAREVLRWEATQKEVRTMIESTWNWMSKAHQGHFPKCKGEVTL